MEDLPNIDRKSFKPAYVQLVNILRNQIAFGQFKPGERLPSESQLCKRYEVSPMTVRRAINILLQQGLVSTTQGRGTFVKSIELSTVKFGLEELREVFSQNKVKLLEVRIIKADPDIAERLTIKTGERVILIRRIILKDEEPISYHQEFLIYDPTRPIVEGEMEVTALHGLFAGTEETSFKRGELAIKATVLNEKEANLLTAQTNLPSFRIEHLFFDFYNKPVSWGFLICRGDKLSFKTTVGLNSDIDIPDDTAGDKNEH
jgi:DNA-binding GntR family transcriptional regulator